MDTCIKVVLFPDTLNVIIIFPISAFISCIVAFTVVMTNSLCNSANGPMLSVGGLSVQLEKKDSWRLGDCL